jgi:UPF0716 family protein affecting phage T7 exclusion
MYPVKVGQVWKEKKFRKWLLLVVAAFVALQIYFIQEMLVALMFFTGVFILCALAALAFYLIDKAGQWGLGWAGQQMRRGLTAAEEVSKKQLRHPRSETAR